MTYYVTWIVDGPALLTAIDGTQELALDEIMAKAFELEEIEPGSTYEIGSIIRAANAEIVW